MLQKLRIVIFGQFWLKSAVFAIFDQVEKLFFRKVYIQKIPLLILKPLICFEPKNNL